MSVQIENFGEVAGKKVDKITIENDILKVCILNYGALIQSLYFKEVDPGLDLILGYDDIEGYLGDPTYQGQTIGRYSNRIGNAQITIDGTVYNLDNNDNGNCLHSGFSHLGNSFWNYEKVSDECVRFSCVSPDGQSGFPGNLDVKVEFSINDNGDLSIEYFAETDKKTVVSLTNHSYFNVNGHDSGDILSNKVQINSDAYTEVNENLSATGKNLPVDEYCDFREFAACKERVKNGMNDFDQNYVIKPDISKIAASIIGEKSGIRLNVFTDNPGVQFYNSVFVNIPNGKGGFHYKKYAAICFEPQEYPDSPNQPDFPSPLLAPGEKYNRKIIYQFKDAR